MRRREVLTLLGGAAAWPLAAHAQPAKRIGFLGATTLFGVEARLKRFRDGLRDLGYVEGQNILIDFRWAEGRYARLEEFAAELVRFKVDVLVTYGTPRATTAIPIVMLTSGDAVATGAVASLARPGGNVTGSTFFDPELSAKQVELFKEAYPPARRLALLLNPGNPVNAPIVQAVGRTARSLQLELEAFEARGSDEIDSALLAVIKTRADAVAVTADAIFAASIERIIAITSGNRLAAIGAVELAQAGGLIGYGPYFPDLWYRGAAFVDKILKGARPADLPVEQPTRFVLAINLKTAKALGLEVPPTLLARADEVIE